MSVSQVRLLLDTNVVLDALRARNNRRAFLAGVLRTEGQLFLSTLSLAEITLATRPAEARDTAKFLDSLTQVPVTAAIARRAGYLKTASPAMSMTDAVLAATAVELDLLFVTDTRERYMAEGLRFYKPPAPTVESLLPG